MNWTRELTREENNIYFTGAIVGFIFGFIAGALFL